MQLYLDSYNMAVVKSLAELSPYSKVKIWFGERGVSFASSSDIIASNDMMDHNHYCND